MGNGEAKELTCTTHGHEWGGGDAGGGGEMGEKNRTTVIAQSIKCT